VASAIALFTIEGTLIKGDHLFRDPRDSSALRTPSGLASYAPPAASLRAVGDSLGSAQAALTDLTGSS
jgi:hypothetical protein